MHRTLFALPLLAVLSLSHPASAADELPLQAHELFTRAQAQPFYAEMAVLKPVVLPTSDGLSFSVIWIPGGKPPKHWIVSLHGDRSFATDDLVVWAPYLAKRDVGIICLQWWLGKGDTATDYYSPREIYREVDALMQKLRITPQTTMFEATGRGAANLYAIAAFDRLKRQYFSLFVANAGGANMGYQPTQTVDGGIYGAAPYAGSKWVTACGQNDPNLDRDGCPAMRAAATWVQKMGGHVLMRIEDPNGGHGALHQNGDNINKLLNLFLSPAP